MCHDMLILIVYDFGLSNAKTILLLVDCCHSVGMVIINYE